MCPLSTDSTGDQREFAARVLAALLGEIAVRNANADESKGRYAFVVSHAWTEGAMMYLVYSAPPSDRVWGLARDTRCSLINRGPWNDTDDPGLYYYLLDLEENWPGLHSRQPGESDMIWWDGYPLDGLVQRPEDIPGKYRYTPPPPDPSWVRRDPEVVNEPRRYANPH